MHRPDNGPPGADGLADLGVTAQVEVLFLGLRTLDLRNDANSFAVRLQPGKGAVGQVERPGQTPDQGQGQLIGMETGPGEGFSRLSEPLLVRGVFPIQAVEDPGM